MIVPGGTRRTLHENYAADGNLFSRIDLVDNTKKPLHGSNETLVHKFWVVTGVLGLTAIAIILLAAVLVVWRAPRPGFYNETCINRACLKELNLKCTGYICKCTSEQYYSNKCVPNRVYMQTCGSKTSNCQSGKNLVCLDGMCKCGNTTFWNGESCISKSNYTQQCTSNEQCYTNTMMECDSTWGLCLCPETRFWDGFGCPLKKEHKESCNTNIPCNDLKDLKCINNTCNCNSTQYWDPFELRCYNKRVIEEVCQYSFQCFEPMNCTNGECFCEFPFSYNDIPTSTCKPKMTINETCIYSYMCRRDKTLSCVDGTCLCVNNTRWSTDRNTCILPKTYGQQVCSYISDCYYENGLICNSGSICNCPISSVSGMCDCPRSYGNETYWDGSKCSNALTNGMVCVNSSSTYMCKWMTEGTVCNSSSTGFTCQCPVFEYYETSVNACRNQTSYDTNCTLSISCRADLGLSCQNGKCLCNSTSQFWHPTNFICTNRYTYTDNRCTADYMCTSSLICNTASTGNCYCPVSLGSGTCDCPRAVNNETYWDGQNCISALENGVACSNSTTTYMCKWLTEGTICSSTGSSFKCQCPSFQYFETSVSACRNQTMYDTNCTTTLSCRSDLGLSCQNTRCLCNSTSQFWHPTNLVCTNRYTYTDNRCTADYMCASSLICNTASTGNCYCPVSLGTGSCDCPRAVNNETYWNGLACVSALSNGISCSNSTTTYMCKWMTEGTTCNSIGGSFKCQCPSLQYFETSVSACRNQTLVNTNCTSTLSCRSDLGLSCQNSFCLCNTTSQFWHPTNLVCTNRYTYTDNRCTADYMCASSLKCNTASSGSNCNCPVILNSNTCDCPRAMNNETYWNGLACVSALSNGISCSNSTTTYMCKWMTEGTTCNSIGGSFKCQCPSLQYFETSVSACRNQTSYNTSCTISLSCRSDLGLSCQFNLCLCNSSSQYWSTTLLTCTNYLAYSQSTCLADGDCAPSASLICNTAASTRCNCPLSLATGACDCPRVFGRETFWNGIKCEAARNVSQSCSNGTTAISYMCQTITQGTYCDNVTRTCQCYSYGGFSVALNKCVYCSLNQFYFNGQCIFISSSTFTSVSTGFNTSSVYSACNSNSSMYAVVRDNATWQFIRQKVSNTGLYWIGATSHIDGNNCAGSGFTTTAFSSDDYTWNLGSTIIGWCSGGFPIGKISGNCANCALYNAATNCFQNDDCTKSYKVLCLS